jgi:drug/metabolite transporter (DMT)-like permease
MKGLSAERTGELVLLLGAIIWSVFPVLTQITYSYLGPITSLAWTTFIALIFFFWVSVVRKSWVNIFKKDILFSLLMVAAINGIFFYLLFFIGLQYTSAGNAAIVATLEIFFTYLFFNIWRKEFISFSHIVGMLLMFVSAVVILSPGLGSFQKGDLLILLAVSIAPLGNLFQKKLRTKMNSEQILFYRTLIASVFLFTYAFFVGETITVVPTAVWPILLFSGVILFGLSKIMWVEGLHRVSVTKAISINSISPIFTIFFALVILKELPTLAQLISVPLALGGIYLLTRN